MSDKIIMLDLTPREGAMLVRDLMAVVPAGEAKTPLVAGAVGEWSGIEWRDPIGGGNRHERRRLKALARQYER